MFRKWRNNSNIYIYIYKDGIVRFVTKTIKPVCRSIFKKAMEMVIKIIRRAILIYIYTFDLASYKTSITRKRKLIRLSNKLIDEMEQNGNRKIDRRISFDRIDHELFTLINERINAIMSDVINSKCLKLTDKYLSFDNWVS